jgi:hypothetical protein
MTNTHPTPTHAGLTHNEAYTVEPLLDFVGGFTEGTEGGANALLALIAHRLTALHPPLPGDGWRAAYVSVIGTRDDDAVLCFERQDDGAWLPVLRSSGAVSDWVRAAWDDQRLWLYHPTLHPLTAADEDDITFAQEEARRLSP